MLSGWLSTSPSWLNDTRRRARWPIGPQLRVWSCSASHSRCGERALIPILYLWIIPMHRQTQGANPRDVIPADLQALSHEFFGNVVLSVRLPHAQPLLSLPHRKTSDCRLERRCILAADQALSALVEHQLHELLAQEASRETRQAFRLPATAAFPLARFSTD